MKRFRLKRIAVTLLDRFQNLAMKTQMSAYILLLAFVPFVLIIFYLWDYCSSSFAEIIRTSSLESYETKIVQLEYYTDNFLKVYDEILEDQQLVNYIENEHNPSLTAYWINGMIQGHLAGFPDELAGIYVLTGKDREYLVNFLPEKYYISIRNEAREKYRNIRDIAEKTETVSQVYSEICSFRDFSCIAVARNILDESGDVIGKMVFLLEDTMLVQMMKHTPEQDMPWDFRITSGGDNILYGSPDYDKLVQAGEEVRHKIGRAGWEISCAVDTDSIQKTAFEKFAWILIFIILIYAVMVVLLMKVIKGQLKWQEQIIARQNEKNIQSMQLQKNAELKALELEINPHYLYNTLNSINGLAIEHQDYAVSRMLKIFTSNLIYVLKDRFQPVSLRSELQWLEEYLQLQKYRFGTRFDYEIDVDPEVEELSVYKLLLQPFVENAIMHGFARMQSGGILTILVSREESEILIQIYDNGQGIVPEKLEKLQHILRHPMEEADTGLGLLNSGRRMQGYYGDRWSVTIESRPGEGTAVKMRLPVISCENG